MSTVTATQHCYDSSAVGITVYEREPIFRQVRITDEAFFNKIVHTYSDAILAVAFRITKNRDVSEDIVQESFMKLWHHRTEIVFLNVGSWLCRVASNMACNHLKREAAKKKVISALRYDRHGLYASGGEEHLLMKERLALFERAYSYLPPQQKIVYQLSRVNDMTRLEIASHLNISPNTVKNHLTKAVQFLKDNIALVSMVPLFLTIQILFSKDTSTNDRFNCLYSMMEQQYSVKDSKNEMQSIYRKGIVHSSHPY